MIFLAAEVQSVSTGLPVWQFIMAVAVGPVATITAVMWTYSLNNKKAAEVRMELVKSIDTLAANLAVRISELKDDLSKRMDKTDVRATELKTDINSQIGALKTDLTAQAHQLRSDVQAGKAEVEKLLKTQMEAGFLKVGGEVKELKADLNGQMSDLRADSTAQAVQLRSDMQALKSEATIQAVQLRSDMQALKSEATQLRSDIGRNHSEILQRINTLTLIPPAAVPPAAVPPTAARVQL
jgi:hypothetical protein